VTNLAFYRSQKHILSTCIFLTFLLCSGCGSKEPDASHIIQLREEADRILNQYPNKRQSQELPLPDLPVYRALKIKSIILRSEGIYFVQSSFFVTESGIFIPRDQKLIFSDGGDPAYFSVREGIYQYRIKG